MLLLLKLLTPEAEAEAAVHRGAMARAERMVGRATARAIVNACFAIRADILGWG